MGDWYRCFQPLPHPRARLVCFPYAGGGARLFHPWATRFLTDAIEVWAIQLPGRENRIRETPLNKIKVITKLLANHFPFSGEIPLIFLGQSLGAILAFELIRYLRQFGRLTPHLFFVAAAAAPHLPNHNPPFYHLPRQDFLESLQLYFRGLPAPIFENTELLDVVLPALRADLQIYETYTYHQESPFQFPLIVLGGLNDETISRNDLQNWQQHTTSAFELHLLPGNHFFIQQEAEKVISIVKERVGLYLN